jgi:hypothetical protein
MARIEVKVYTYQTTVDDADQRYEECKQEAVDVLGEGLTEITLIDYMKEMCPDCVKEHMSFNELETIALSHKYKATRRIINPEYILDVYETKNGNAAIWLEYYPIFVITQEKYEDFRDKLEQVEGTIVK